MKKKLCFITLFAMLISVAQASEYNGVIEGDGLRFGSPDPAGVRVSISVPQNTACPIRGWYAYENAATGMAGLWTTALIQAKIHAHRVTIIGNKVCDRYGIEGIASIDLTSTTRPSVPGPVGPGPVGPGPDPRPGVSCSNGQTCCGPLANGKCESCATPPRLCN